MPDFHGPLQHVTTAGTLWAILAFPLLAAVFCGWRALFGRPGARGRSQVARASVAAQAVAFAASVTHAVLLASKPELERFFVQHLWRMVRVGQLDASFDLALDPLASTMTLVITGIALPIFVFASSYMLHAGDVPPPTEPRAARAADAAYARFFAWMNGFVVAMLVLVLADNLVLLFFGWEGVGLCSWGLIGHYWRDPAKAGAGTKAFVVNRVGDAAFLVGVALVYWGLGGAWIDGDYVPDLNARFSSVEVSDTEGAPEAEAKPQDAVPPHVDEPDPDEAPPDEPPPTEERNPDAPAAEAAPERRPALPLPDTTGGGSLSLTTYSGALVFMDDARTPLQRRPGVPLRAPFSRFPVRGGLHSFRIHVGGGVDDVLVTHVAFGGGREVALASFGPSVTFRNVRDQLVARDARGHAPFAEALVAKHFGGPGSLGIVTVACLLLFAGVVAKSAQFPLYVWLPDAMAGPTPVSALIHAATMVTAGVYLVARLSFLFVLSPPACMVIAITGAGTALFAAVMGLYQYDLKRILAYSTVSQLGIMVLGVGVGGYAAGVFHLVTHACFKALLFLGAGAVIHAAHTQDIRAMGGLRPKLPLTARAYFVGCLAITAAPIPGLGGFWSKDDVLVSALLTRNVLVPGWALCAVGLVVTALTSFYVWRSWFVVFEGDTHADAHAPLHEPPPAMTGALTALAALTAVVGLALGVGPKLIGREGETLLEAWLAPSLRDGRAPFANGGPAVTWGVTAAAYVAALAGWALAKRRYQVRAGDWVAREREAPLFAASTRGFWLDAIYAHTVVAFAVWARAFLAELDQRVVDGTVHAAALATRVTAWLVGRVDDDVVDGAVRALSESTLHAGERVRAAQTGRVQSYVLAIALGVLALAFLQYWLR